MTEHPGTASGALVIHCCKTTRTVDGRDSPVIIGRGETAHVRIDDPRISRSHVRLEARPDGTWVAMDAGSRNGFFIGGVRQDSTVIADGTIIALGDPAGVEVRLEYADEADGETTTYIGASEDQTDWHREIDPGIARAGAAARARREQLNISQRRLAEDGVINAGALRAFEMGRSWPRRGTQERLEEVLQWPPGTIRRLRYDTAGAAGSAQDEVTATITNVDGVPHIVQAIATAVQTAQLAVAALPPPQDLSFTSRAAPILANLRQLEAVAASAAMDVKGTPTFAITLSTIRRLYTDLMTRAAESPKATLGQRLYAARRKADLTVAETAAAAHVSTDTIDAVEADQEVPVHVAARIEALIAELHAA